MGWHWMALEPQHPCFHPAPLFEGCTGAICAPCGNRDLLVIHKLLHPLRWVAKMGKDSSFFNDFFAKWTTKALLLHYWTNSSCFEPESKGMKFSPTILSCPLFKKHLPPTSKNMTFATHQGNNSLGAQVNISGFSLPSILGTFTRLSCHTSW